MKLAVISFTRKGGGLCSFLVEKLRERGEECQGRERIEAVKKRGRRRKRLSIKFPFEYFSNTNISQIVKV